MKEIIRIDLDGVNCYLGKAEEGFILFDTGGHLIMDKEYTDRREKLCSYLDKAGCRPGNLKLIILTHGDSDHSGNAAFLREKYQTSIAMHRADTELVKGITLSKRMESFHYRSPIYRFIFRLMRKKILKITERVHTDYTPFEPDILLQDGEALQKYGLPAKVVHLPGHTPGSIGILCETGELIAGDIFVNLKKPSLAPNAADFSQMERSAHKLSKMKLSMVYPGHGEPFAAEKAPT